MKISFVTTCKGRAFNLKETYIENILIALDEYKNVEFVLVNYDSPDDMDEWVNTNLSDFLESGVVKYLKVHGKQFYVHPHATNIGYRYATGDVIVTLEADNSFQKGFVLEINALFSTQNDIGFAWFPIFIKGATSRIAIRKECFDLVNGYNESLKGWGFDDMDLRKRLCLLRQYKLGFLDLKHGLVKEHSDFYRRCYNQFSIFPLVCTNILNHLKSRIGIFFHGFRANGDKTYGALD